MTKPKSSRAKRHNPLLIALALGRPKSRSRFLVAMVRRFSGVAKIVVIGRLVRRAIRVKDARRINVRTSHATVDVDAR